MILDQRIVTRGASNVVEGNEAGGGPVPEDGQSKGQSRPSACQMMAESESLGQTWRVMRELGDRYVDHSDFSTARECYLLAHCLAPQEPEPLVRFGVLAIQSDELDSAQQAFDKARGLDPEYAEAYNGSAMVLQMRKDYSRAFEMYLKCLKLNPDNLTALLGLFQTSCQMGTFSKIIHYLEMYLERHPGDADVLACLNTLYKNEGQGSKAKEAMDKSRELELDSV